jgi:hypothetical protein
MLQSKCEIRLQATKDLSKEKPWLPRLERLALLRGLDEFEKRVICLIIGGIISTDIRKAGHSSSYLSGMSRIGDMTFDVGTILMILCDNLSEQIKSRSYFYKSGKLIR